MHTAYLVIDLEAGLDVIKKVMISLPGRWKQYLEKVIIKNSPLCLRLPIVHSHSTAGAVHSNIPPPRMDLEIPYSRAGLPPGFTTSSHCVLDSGCVYNWRPRSTNSSPASTLTKYPYGASTRRHESAHHQNPRRLLATNLIEL